MLNVKAHFVNSNEGQTLFSTNAIQSHREIYKSLQSHTIFHVFSTSKFNANEWIVAQTQIFLFPRSTLD